MNHIAMIIELAPSIDLKIIQPHTTKYLKPNYKLPSLTRPIKEQRSSCQEKPAHSLRSKFIFKLADVDVMHYRSSIHF